MVQTKRASFLYLHPTLSPVRLIICAPIPAERSHDVDAVFGKKDEIGYFATYQATLLDTSVHRVFIQGLKSKTVYLDWRSRAHLAQLLQIKPAGHRQDDLEPWQWIDWEMLMEKWQER